MSSGRRRRARVTHGPAPAQDAMPGAEAACADDAKKIADRMQLALEACGALQTADDPAAHLLDAIAVDLGLVIRSLDDPACADLLERVLARVRLATEIHQEQLLAAGKRAELGLPRAIVVG